MAQQDKEEGEKHAVYYLSKKFLEYETRYSSREDLYNPDIGDQNIETLYGVTHPIHLISRMDPIKYLFEKMALTGRVARWLLLLSEFDITFLTQKFIKEWAFFDYFAPHPIQGDRRPLEDPFLDEDFSIVNEDRGNIWKLYFNGTANQKGCGVQVLLITPNDLYLPLAFRLDFPCTNNIAEYETCVIGLKMALIMGIQEIKVYGDSSIVIYQTQRRWKTKDEKLKSYQEHLEGMIKQVGESSFDYLPRDGNRVADALAILASMYECDPET
ncbi:uncharacterized protein LOC122650728 [Telopea speciosissima]|uniref:uncharacterized protein LOC122650728 n=1 Tax=Telopea speciosissima TaxID=54955 RepID=UPI001CC7CFEA|nr:uncharacterized protein LOC122650728 [Telopea speciosissima]